MQTTEAQQLLLDILKNVNEGNSIQFRYIRSWQDFRYCRQQLRSTKLIIKTLESSSKKLLKSYCKDVTSGISDVNTLLACTRLKDVIAFYEKDLDTLKRMLDDYDNYLGEGYFWYSFLGGKRVI